MSSSAFPLATLLLVAAGAGLIALAMNEDKQEAKEQETNTFRSRVFDVSPTRSATSRPTEEEGVEPPHEAEPSAGQWLSDSLAQLEESYQAMREEGEELAQEALHALEKETPSEPAEQKGGPLVVAPSPVAAAADFAQPMDAELPADQLLPPEPNAQDDHGGLLAQDFAQSEQTLANTDLNAVPSYDATEGIAQGEAPLSPEDALRAEQLRIAVALENQQAFILSLLPLFLPVPSAADLAVPGAGVYAGPIPAVDMSGLAPQAHP